MHRAAFPYLLACLCLAGCAVSEYQYPIAWQPLVPQPDTDCREFQGRFADRGERADEPSKPSLTRELSKGNQQKVQFAAAVIHDPELVVLDEPFSGLDPINSRLLKDLILEQRAKGTTVILSTHRMEEVEALCESICLVYHGRAVLSGRLSDIKARYGRNTIAVEHGGGGVAGVARLALSDLINHEVNLGRVPANGCPASFLPIIGSSPFSFRYGSHMSEQTKQLLEMTVWPMAVKNPWKDSMVRSLPTQSRRVMPISIW